MTDCTFFDDEQPTTTLPQWATITQVSDVLAVPPTAIRSAVRRAGENQEDWVKKEIGEGGRTHYLIDTTHERYASQELHWKQKRSTRKKGRPTSPVDWSQVGDSFFARTYPKNLPLPVPPSPPRFSGHREDHVDEVLHRWVKFRQQLSSWGIQIFQNILAQEDQEDSWQWRWGSLHGEGYPTVEEAILAALENRLMTNEEEEEDQALGDPSSFSQALSIAQGPSHRFNFFNRKRDFPPY